MSSPSAFQLTYQGSVKNVYRDVADPNINYFAFTDDYSVFDWGKMPDTLSGKGRSLSLFGGLMFRKLTQPESWQALFQSEALQSFSPSFLATLKESGTYKQLCRCGLHHHFLGWVDAEGQPLEVQAAVSSETAPYMKVRAVEVNRPRPFSLDCQTVYEYELPTANRIHNDTMTTPVLLPLEVVFRFGMTEGSSLAGRLGQFPGYARQLGLAETPEQGAVFSRPVIEFFTKLEPTDRYLSFQEAFLISGLAPEDFTRLYETALLLSLWLFDFFSSRSVQLWDGKFEFAWDTQGVMLVDSIGPDELRLTCNGVQLSKETIRRFYRGSSWEQAARQAKQQAASQPGADWRQICENDFDQRPLSLTPAQKQFADSLYPTLLATCFEEARLAGNPELSTLLDMARQAEKQEVGAR